VVSIRDRSPSICVRDPRTWTSPLVSNMDQTFQSQPEAVKLIWSPIEIKAGHGNFRDHSLISVSVRDRDIILVSNLTSF